MYCLDSSWCENPNPCLNGNCTDVGENFTCSCEDGFEGERCEIGENYWAWLVVDFFSHWKLEWLILKTENTYGVSIGYRNRRGSLGEQETM